MLAHRANATKKLLVMTVPAQASGWFHGVALKDRKLLRIPAVGLLRGPFRCFLTIPRKQPRACAIQPATVLPACPSLHRRKAELPSSRGRATISSYDAPRRTPTAIRRN